MGILDPQGRAVESSLQSLGFKNVSGVKVGKYILLEVQARTASEARDEAKKMCDELLANPVIEDYRFEVDGDEVRRGAVSGVDGDQDAYLPSATPSGRTRKLWHQEATCAGATVRAFQAASPTETTFAAAPSRAFRP